MNHTQLEHAMRAACQIIDRTEVIVVGSQAILGTYAESQLPAEATMSRECDILPIADGNEETARLADVIEGVAGERSPFEDQHGFGLDGVDLTTVILPPAAKLASGREKDTTFVRALLQAGLIHRDVLDERLLSMAHERPIPSRRAIHRLHSSGHDQT